MAYIKRALKSVQINKTKTILMTLLFFVIGNCIIVTLGITNAIKQAKINVRKQSAAIVECALDTDKWRDYLASLNDEQKKEAVNKGDQFINDKMINSLSNDSRILCINAIRNEIVASDISAVPMSSLPSDYDLVLRGVDMGENIEFVTGKFTITSGRNYTDKDDHVCLISEQLAQYNSLKVGDLIPIYLDTKSEYAYRNFKPVEFEIIGIYHTDELVDSSMKMSFDYNSPYNLVLTDRKTLVEEIVQYHNDYIDASNGSKRNYINVEDTMRINNMTILLDDPLHVEDFMKEHENDLSEYFIFDADMRTFEQLSRPMDILDMFSKFTLMMVLVSGVLVTMLMAALNIRRRKTEIATIMSVGVSRIRIILQHFTELLIIVVLGFTLSILSGQFIASKIGNSLLEKQMKTAVEPVKENISFSTFKVDYFTEISSEQFVESYDVKVNGTVILEIYGLSVLIVFVSILIPSMMILRFDPKKILMEIR